MIRKAAKPEALPRIFPSEVLVTLVLLAVMVGLVFRFAGDMESAEERDLRKAREGIMLITSAVGAYAFDLGLPAPATADGGLDVVVEAGYFDAVPKDPWGRDYIYNVPPIQGNMAMDLYSLGPDGVESDDDVINWNLYGRRYVGTSRIARKRDNALRKTIAAGDP